jgi:hypothetical protein
MCHLLKLLIPQDGAAGRHEIAMLRLTGALGCVGLLRDDAARGRCCWSASGLPSASLPTHSPSGWRYWWRPRPRCGGRRRAPARLLERTKLANSSSSSPLSGRSLAIRAPGGRRACPGPARRMAAHDDKRAVLVRRDVHELNVPLGPWPRHVVLARYGGSQAAGGLMSLLAGSTGGRRSARVPRRGDRCGRLSRRSCA